MKKRYFVFVALVISFLLFSQGIALAAPQPVRAFQLRFHFEFVVYRTEDMPANWFRTYDGYYVTRALGGDWVYGELSQYGIMSTNILVNPEYHRTTELFHTWRY
jgi:hypothetical protein